MRKVGGEDGREVRAQSNYPRSGGATEWMSAEVANNWIGAGLKMKA
jgi:hypothetical protein